MLATPGHYSVYIFCQLIDLGFISSMSVQLYWTIYIFACRFIQTLNPDGSSQMLLPEESLRKGDLTPAMDIFSAGCALTELFNEVHDAPFDLSELLAYCSSEDNDFKHLDNLEDPDIRVNFSITFFFSTIAS